jgi:hypothetical protein
MNTTTQTKRSSTYSVVISGVLLTLGFLPLTWWFSVLTHAWRARLYLGHWPYYNNPDPKSLPDHFHPQTEILERVVPWSGLLILVIVCLLLLGIVKDHKKRMLCASVLVVLGWISAVALLFFDPGGFFEWILD